MLETFYSTGMRRMEVAGLKLYDLDLNAALSRPAGQGQEGPHRADRRAGGGVDEEVHQRSPSAARRRAGRLTVFLTNGASSSARITLHARRATM